MASKTAPALQDDEQYEIPVEDALELARGHHLSGNFILAERTYHDVLRAVPDHPSANHLLGAMYYQLGNIENAIHFMKGSVELEPGEKQYWCNYGSVLSIHGQYEDAITAFDQALSLDPNHVEALNNKAMTYWQAGKYKEAEDTAQQSLAIAPNNLDGSINLGLSLAKQEKFTDALIVWGEASKHHPQDPRIWNNWANMLREMKQPQRAKTLLKKALEIAPQDTDVLNNLGCVLRELGQSEQAIEYFRKVTNITPKYYQAHYNMALAYYDLGQYENAVIAARYAIDFHDNYADGYTILSSALIEVGEFGQAHFAAQKAVQLDRENAEAYMSLADVLYLSAHFDDGHAALKEALKRDSDNPRAYMKLANVYERLDDMDSALAAIDKAIELAPHAPVFLARKGSMLHISNDIEGALEYLDKALEMAPGMLMAHITKAEVLIAVNKTDEAEKAIRLAQEINKEFPPIYSTISTLKKFKSEDDEDFQLMLSLEDKVENSMGLNFASSLHFSIAKAYESMKNYDKAFEYYDKANQERRAITPYDSTHQPPTFEIIKNEYPKTFLDELKGKGFESDVPIFIVGMPRSGTTLTEQIISSHPDVFGAGELPDITRTKKKIGDLNPDSAAEMGKTYVELASARNKGAPAKHITDKMPGNYMNIGFIASILPNAKIIHCCRDPLDTCLSNFKQSFLNGQFWSYNQEELAAEYLRYLDLMEYWHEILPGRVLDIHYEDTVNNPEAQTRKLIEYVGLEWDDACLEPHKQKRAVLTASKGQVTKPVYTSSVQGWKRYEKQLQPLVRILKPDEALPI